MGQSTCVALCLWILTGLSTGNLSCLASGSDRGAANGQTESALRVDDLHPVYGKCGSKRHATFVAGEQLHFAANISGISISSDAHCDCVGTYSLVDSSGKTIEGSSGRIDIKDTLCLGGDVLTVYFCVNTEMSVLPGRHTLRFVVHDNLNKQTAKRDLEITLRDMRTFGILNAGLFRDRECAHGASGNFTLGQPIYMQCDIRVPRNKNNEAITEYSATVLDHNNQVVREWKPERRSAKQVAGSGIQFFFRIHATVATAGRYRVHIEAKNMDTNEIDRCDLPVLVSAPPVASESEGSVRHADVLKRDGNRRPLLLDACTTDGEFGNPSNRAFISGERVFFFMLFSGLSTVADQRADCSMELSIVDSHSNIRRTGKEEMRGLLVSGNGSFAGVMWYDVKPDTEPGHYTARLTLKDNIGNGAVQKDVAITIVDNDRLALGSVNLSADQAGKVAAGPNLTVGEKIYVQCGLFLPKTSNGNDVEVTASFCDGNRKELARIEPRRMRNVASAASSAWIRTAPIYIQAFSANRAGSYFVRLEMRDLVTRGRVSKEMPFSVFLPPELPKPRRVESEQGTIKVR
jgi:hypothetical protein